jgi:hypothetical protein
LLKNKTEGIRAFTAITLSMVLFTGLGASIESAFANPGSGTIFAVEPNSRNLYTVSNAGVFNLVGNTVVLINTLAYDPSSQIMYGGEGGGGLGNPNAGNFYIVDQTNGVTTLVGNNGIGQSYDGLDFGLGGAPYGVLNNDDLVIIDETTGLILTNFGNTGINVKGISFDTSGVLWAIAQNGNLYTINTSTAQSTFVLALTDNTVEPASLQLLCDGTTYVGTKFFDLRFGTIDRSTGAFTQLSFSPNDTIGGLTATHVCVVGGELLPINTSALLLAGAQTNAVWIMSILVVIGSVAFGALYITTKKN